MIHITSIIYSSALPVFDAIFKFGPIYILDLNKFDECFMANRLISIDGRDFFLFQYQLFTITKAKIYIKKKKKANVDQKKTCIF